MIALAVMTVLAGCHGLLPWVGEDSPELTPTTVENDLDGRPTDSPTRTDGDTETATETKTETEPEYLVPGLTNEGVLNASALLERHYAVLERESENGTYVAASRSNRTVLGVQSREVFTGRQQYVVQYPERLYHSWTQLDHTNNETTVYEEWVNESDALLLANHSDEPVRYDAQDGVDTPGHPYNLDRELKETLRSVDPRRTADVAVDRRVHDGTTVYVVTGTTRRGASFATSTFYIRGDGFITHYSWRTIRNQASGGPVVTYHHLAFDIRPDGTLEPPDWAAEAREEADKAESDDE